MSLRQEQLSSGTIQPGGCKPTKSPRRNGMMMPESHNAVRLNWSRRTEEAYLGWLRRFLVFRRARCPAAGGEEAVREFLAYLTERRHVSGATQ